MDRAGRGQQSSASLDQADENRAAEDRTNNADTGQTTVARRYRTKHMKMYPELYRSDVSINPSYSGLKNLPYYVVCRRRALKKKRQIARQLNREIMHIAMMQSFALAGVRVDRIFTIGFPPEATLVKNGYIRRVTDDEVKSLALEIAGTNVATTFIYAPKNPKTVLGITLPFLVMVIKSMKRYFTFEITILDDKNMHRRFRISNFNSTTKVRPFCTSMPIGLEEGWYQVNFNLADFTRRAYGSNYLETTRMQIHANCRIRRVYFADRLYADNDLPDEYRLFIEKRQDACVREEKKKEKRPSRPSRPSQERIPVEAVPADEAPAFRVDSRQSVAEERRTTPLPSKEPSRVVVAPDGASKVRIEMDQEPEVEEAEETPERETEDETELEAAPESEVDEAMTDQEETAVEQRESATFSPVEEEEETGVQAFEAEENEEPEEIDEEQT